MYGIPINKAPHEKLFAANHQRMDCEGTTKLFVSNKRYPVVNIDAIVSLSIKDDIIVSWHDLQALGILSPQFPNVVNSIGDNSSGEEGVIDTLDARETPMLRPFEFSHLPCLPPIP